MGSFRGGMFPLLFGTILLFWGTQFASGIECERQRTRGNTVILSYNQLRFLNHTIVCSKDFSWEWTVARICCYDNYDRWNERPYCCYSELYKLVVGVGLVCVTLVGTSMLLFCCWWYNLPHHLLYCLTFRRFALNDWLLKTRNGPYVDPSYYLKEPFWSRGGAFQTADPLRPMPPRIFYPAPPTNLKWRGWDIGGDIPLFILASRQFHRNPYSARPHDRTPPIPSHSHSHPSDSRRSSVALENVNERRGSAWGRRNSTTTGSQAQMSPHLPTIVAPAQIVNEKTCSSANSSRKGSGAFARTEPFGIPFDEAEAASELREAVRLMEVPEVEEVEASTGFQTLTTEETRVWVTSASGERRKVSVSILNQQLSSSLGLSIANLPQIQVIGNFTMGRIDGNSSMETIEEDEDAMHNFDIEGRGDFRGRTITPEEKRRNSQPETHAADVNIDGKQASSKPTIPSLPTVPRISSALLDRIVTHTRQEVPFRPSLPGAVPEDEDVEDTLDEMTRQKRKARLSRRNSAPVHF